MQAVFLYLFWTNCARNGVFIQATMEPFIVGGESAKIRDFPHSARLHAVSIDGTTDNYSCGSSILNQKILLTAAHCVKPCGDNCNMSAMAGSAYIDKMPLIRYGTRLIYHPKYNEKTVHHDVAIVYLSKNLPFGPNIKRISIRPVFPLNTNVIVAGWGVIRDYPKQKATRLKSVTQTLLPKHACRKLFLSQDERDTEGIMCAKHNRRNRPSCGDSGSALLSNDYTQIGVVSYRDDKLPEIVMYTNVTYFYSWIKHNAEKLYCGRK